MSRAQRKKAFVDTSVQGALLKRIFAHWVTFFLVAGFSVILLQTLLGDPSLGLMERLRLQAGEFWIVAIVMISLFPAFMLDTIRFSNRFVGPIARLRRHLRQLGEGDTSTCVFRGNDFWSGMAEEFNAVAKLVESQQQEIAQLKHQVANAPARQS